MDQTRELRFEGIPNCRDLGGIRTKDGRVVRERLLLRSAHLARATSADVVRLCRDYRLCRVIDLRNPRERTGREDVPVPQAERLEQEVFSDTKLGITHDIPIDDERAMELMPGMEQLYAMMTADEECQAALGRILRGILSHDPAQGAQLWHCSEGKDRCGVVSALVLGALGASWEDILQDYLLTNRVNGPKAQGFYDYMLNHGKSETFAAFVRDVFLAKASYLRAAFRAVDEAGGMRAYLTGPLGLQSALLDRFCAAYTRA